MVIYQDIIKIFTSIVLGYLIGYERRVKEKPVGRRTGALISLGATLAVLVTFKLNKYQMDFDAIRAIAYYLVALGFIGGGIVRTRGTKVENITTGALILPVALVGCFVGLGEYILGIFTSIVIFLLLKLKNVQIGFFIKRKKKNKKRRKKNVSK